MFKKLEKWLDDYEKGMYEELISLKEDVAYATPIVRANLSNGKTTVYEEGLSDKFPGYRSWTLPAKYQLRTEQTEFYVVAEQQWRPVDSFYLDAVIELNGKEYLHTVMSKPYHYSLKEIEYDAIRQYILDRGHNVSDMDWIDGRDEEWIRKACAKEKEAKRRYIEEKVREICGEEQKEVAGEEITDLYVKGTNGRTAHIWAITAGGYNIQRLHIRILVKEVK